MSRAHVVANKKRALARAPLVARRREGRLEARERLAQWLEVCSDPPADLPDHLHRAWSDEVHRTLMWLRQHQRKTATVAAKSCMAATRQSGTAMQ